MRFRWPFENKIIQKNQENCKVAANFLSGARVSFSSFSFRIVSLKELLVPIFKTARHGGWTLTLNRPARSKQAEKSSGYFDNLFSTKPCSHFLLCAHHSRGGHIDLHMSGLCRYLIGFMFQVWTRDPCLWASSRCWNTVSLWSRTPRPGVTSVPSTSNMWVAHSWSLMFVSEHETILYPATCE